MAPAAISAVLATTSPLTVAAVTATKKASFGRSRPITGGARRQPCRVDGTTTRSSMSPSITLVQRGDRRAGDAVHLQHGGYKRICRHQVREGSRVGRDVSDDGRRVEVPSTSVFGADLVVDGAHGEVVRWPASPASEGRREQGK